VIDCFVVFHIFRTRIIFLNIKLKSCRSVVINLLFIYLFTVKVFLKQLEQFVIIWPQGSINNLKGFWCKQKLLFLLLFVLRFQKRSIRLIWFARHFIEICIQRKLWLVENSSRKPSLAQEQTWLVESYPVLSKFLPLLS